MLLAEDLKNFEVEKKLIKLLYIIKSDFYQNGEFFTKHFINISPFENDAFILTLYTQWYTILACGRKNDKTTLGWFISDGDTFISFLDYYTNFILKKNNKIDNVVTNFSREFTAFKKITLYNRKDFKEVISGMWGSTLVIFANSVSEIKLKKEQVELIKFIKRINRDYDALTKEDFESVQKTYKIWEYNSKEKQNIFDRYSIIAINKSHDCDPIKTNNIHDFSYIGQYINGNLLAYLYYMDKFFKGDYVKYYTFHNAFIEYCDELTFNSRDYNSWDNKMYTVDDIREHYLENAPIEWWLELARKE